MPSDGEHDSAANLYGVFDAEYTDLGANGQPVRTGSPTGAVLGTVTVPVTGVGTSSPR